MKKKPLRDDPEQAKRFEETARELGAEDASAFERALEVVTPAVGHSRPSEKQSDS